MALNSDAEFWNECVKSVSFRMIPDLTSNAANISAIIYHELIKRKGSDAVNWVGFYWCRKYYDEVKKEYSTALVLGPFHGMPARPILPEGEGVCGRAYTERKTQLIPDVHAIDWHIACDQASQSELVLPILDPESGEVLGVLDLDSPVVNGKTNTHIHIPQPSHPPPLITLSKSLSLSLFLFLSLYPLKTLILLFLLLLLFT